MLRLDMIHVNQKSRFTFCHSKPARLPKSVLIDRCMQEKQRSRSMSGGPKMHNDGKKTWGKCSWKRVSHRFHLLCSLDSLHAIWDVSTFAFFLQKTWWTFAEDLVFWQEPTNGTDPFKCQQPVRLPECCSSGWGWNYDALQISIRDSLLKGQMFKN